MNVDAFAHVLLLSPGAKVGLTRLFAEAVAARSPGMRLFAWEADPHSPAGALCAGSMGGGPVEGEAAARTLLAICVQHRIRLVVPTRHDDLPALAAMREEFIAAGVVVAVSSAACIELCHDKRATHAWLGREGFPAPRQTVVQDYATSAMRGVFPLIAKHPRGSGSRLVRWCRTVEDVAETPSDWLLQTVAPGREHTVNVYVDRAGRSRCEIPHERAMVSEGEVVRGRTTRVPELMDLARRIAERLPGAAGPLNVQMFWDEGARQATVIEINPRFGGGYPLAHQAGGRFVEWLLREHCDGESVDRVENWTSDLLMVRYREAMFFPPGRR